MKPSVVAHESRCGWEHFPHDADIGVRGRGPTPAQAFEHAAEALTAIITHEAVRPQIAVDVQCEAPDLELLFVEWLNAVIYEMAVRKMLFGRFAVRIDGSRLRLCLPNLPPATARAHLPRAGSAFYVTAHEHHRHLAEARLLQH